MFPTYDISYDIFKEFINDFAKELNYPFSEFSINKKEYPEEKELFVYYNAEYGEVYENRVLLSVEIIKDNKTKEVKGGRYLLDLGFNDTPVLFNFYHKIDNTKTPYNLDRWLSNCIKLINDCKRTPFDYYFYDLPYLNYGMEGISNTTAYLFKVTLFGILNADNIKRVWIARIRHIRKDDLYRSFSYAILPFGKIDWLIFPDAVGLDSGGALDGYESIEDSIEEAKKIGDVEIIDIDASLEAFKTKFEYLYTDNVETHNREELYVILSRMKKHSFELTEFFKAAQRIDDEIEKQEYMPALRNMRALIEGLCKYICKANAITIKADDPNINNLSSALLDKKIIDYHIIPWFNAFNSIANEAAHGVDSSKLFDMDYEIETDLFDTTIKLGQHLIIQLFSKV